MEHDRKFQDTLIKQGQPAEQVAEYMLTASQMYGSVEVKADLQAWDTGNLYVEKTSRGKLSGLSTTKADWWSTNIVAVPGRNYDSYEFSPDDVQAVVSIRTPLLRDFIEKERPMIRPGGDSNTSTGHLIPLACLPLSLQATMLPSRVHCPPDCICRL